MAISKYGYTFSKTFSYKTSCPDGLSSVGSSKSFSYTGSVQTFTACAGRTYKLEVWGAQGGYGRGWTNYAYGATGGYGGYAYGTKSFSSNYSLFIVVGGQGQGWSDESGQQVGDVTKSGGYNGGGNYSNSGNGYGDGAGGGATHIATRTGLLSSLSSYKTTILIVAGGGGGNNKNAYASYSYTGDGGSGGGNTGNAGANGEGNGGSGGTQSSGYGFGQGGRK